MIEDFHVMNLKCNGRHFLPSKLHVVGENKTDCRAMAKKLGWRIHEGKYAGRVSCPHCARPRTGITEFPDERPVLSE